jgi:hypothetical protein
MITQLLCQRISFFRILLCARADVDDQSVVLRSIFLCVLPFPHLHLTIFAAEEIQIVATEDLLMNAQICRTKPYPGVFKRIYSSTIETSMIDLQLFIRPLHAKFMGEVIGLHAGIEAVLLFLHYPWQMIVLFHVRRSFLSKLFGRPSTFVLLGHGLGPREKAREVGSRKRSRDLIFRSPKECKAK